MGADQSRIILPRRTALLGGAASLLPLFRPASLAATPPAPAATATPPEAAATPPNAPGENPAERASPPRVDLLFCGDSLAQGMFLTLQPALRRRETLRIINGTLHATGVTRGDEYDWTAVSRDLVARHRPHLVVFWIGANDFRPLVVRALRARHAFGSAGFAELYGQRVAEMVGNAVQGGARAIWLGLPNMRETQFAGAVRQLNGIQQAAAEGAGAMFLPTWDATSDEQGRYMPALALENATHSLRAEDGVHFTHFGYRRIASLLFDAAGERFPELAPCLGRVAAA